MKENTMNLFIMFKCLSVFVFLYCIVLVFPCHAHSYRSICECFPISLSFLIFFSCSAHLLVCFPFGNFENILLEHFHFWSRIEEFYQTNSIGNWNNFFFYDWKFKWLQFSKRVPERIDLIREMHIRFFFFHQKRVIFLRFFFSLVSKTKF